MRIGKYETEEFLGGGMSEVYRAHDTVLGRTVALKILTNASCADPQTKERFLLEARLSSGITHDHIVTAYDYGEENGRPYMVLEFLTGQTLRQAIQAGALPDLHGRVQIMLQIARALEHVHSLNVIHRDIKPDNVHLDASGRAKLMDFGIAKAPQLSLTRTGFTLGTPHYMAPEMLMGQPPSPQVDIYSFGVMLFEVLCGKKPIDADTVERIFYAVLHEPVPVETLAEAGIPESLCDLVRICTQKDPADRMQTFTEVCSRLETFDGGAEHPQRAPRRRVRLNGRVLYACVAASLMLAIAVGTMAVRSSTVAAAHSTPATLSVRTGDMVLIPGGPFKFGVSNETIQLRPFYIDEIEVSNEEYEAFCRATS